MSIRNRSFVVFLVGMLAIALLSLICFFLIAPLPALLLGLGGACLWGGVCQQSVYGQVRRVSAQVDALMSGRPFDRELITREGDLEALFSRMILLHDRLLSAAAQKQKDREAMRRFVEDVSHQLKIPLSSLRLKLEARQLEADEPWIEECLAPIDRMTFLIQSLLKLARLEAGSIRMTFESSPVRLTVMKAAASLEQALLEREQKLRIQGEEDLCLRHDARFLAEALENLIKNASEHSPKGSEITVTYERAAQEGAPMARIRVEDQGPGIPAEELSHVFDRFYRGRLNESAGGAGIGLSLCKFIVEAHHGDIRAQNRPHGGAAFILLLPDLPGSIKENFPS